MPKHYRVANYEVYLERYPDSSEVKHVYSAGQSVTFEDGAEPDPKQLHKLVLDDRKKEEKGDKDDDSIDLGNGAGNPGAPGAASGAATDAATAADAKAAAKARLQSAG